MHELWMDKVDLNDSQTASITCMMANGKRDPERNPEPFKLEDFKFVRRRTAPKVESEDDWKVLYSGMQAYTAHVERRKQIVRKQLT